MGVVEVEYRGAPFPLRMSAHSIMRLEQADATNRPVNQILAEDFADSEYGPSMTAFIRLFQALMWDHMPAATLEDAAEMIDGRVGEHEGILSRAITAGFPDADGDTSGEGAGASPGQ